MALIPQRKGSKKTKRVMWTWKKGLQLCPQGRSVGPLLWAIWYLYNQRKHLPVILFVIFISMISRRSRDTESVQFGNLRIASVFCRWRGPVGFIVLWPPARVGAVCSRVWRSHDESLHLQVWGHGSLPKDDELPPPGWGWVFFPRVKELKYHGVLFTSVSKTECEIDTGFVAASAVWQVFHLTIEVRGKLSQKAKL